MKKVIRLGDPTSHGGTVLSAAPYRVFYDKPVARMGDKVSCPMKGHNNCVIVEGDPSWIVDGKPVALEGHLVSCGAVLISTLKEVDRDYVGGGSASSGASSTQIAATQLSNNKKSEPKKEITNIFFTYGEEEKPISVKSRFYPDINIHIETKNYNEGDTVDVFISGINGSTIDGKTGEFKLSGIVESNGSAKIMMAMKENKITILAKE